MVTREILGECIREIIQDTATASAVEEEIGRALALEYARGRLDAYDEITVGMTEEREKLVRTLRQGYRGSEWLRARNNCNPAYDRREK